MNQFPQGVNSTMLIPYDSHNHIDFSVLGKMIDWYYGKGCSSLFAMCHSTEMHFLSMEERLMTIRCVRENVERIVASGGRRMPVIAAGTFSNDISEMAEQIQMVHEAGADAVVMITNRFDPDNQGGDTLIHTADKLIRRIPSKIPLGLYECPFPYKRVLTLEELQWASEHENIHFLKDTCCNLEMLEKRLDIVRGTQLMLFNANAQTLLPTLRKGASGYSSVMANIHPELYVWLCANYSKYPEEAEHLQHILCFTALSETLSYPLIAKYIMRRQGVPVEINSRMCKKGTFTAYHAHIMDQLMRLTEYEISRLP
jgi:4-hydroxy-tetrahydrodipicolinate synthase